MGYAPEIVEKELSEAETERAGIPPDPNWRALLDERSLLSPEWYDKFLADADLEAQYRRELLVQREAAIAFEQERTVWQPYYERAIEYPCSRIFVALKERREQDDKGILDLPIIDIPGSFWSLKGINFGSSAASNELIHYCHISCETDLVLEVFPGDREFLTAVEKVGETVILTENPSTLRSVSRRGRPPYPWEGFHIEAMAQNSGWLVIAVTKFSRMPFFAALKEAKLRSFIAPGQSLAAKLLHEGSGYAVTKADIRCDGKLTCNAEITFRLVEFPHAEIRASMEKMAAMLELAHD